MTVDIEKLEALAKAATQGEWSESGSYISPTRKEGGTTYVESWRSLALVSEDADRAFIAAANPAAVLELIAELKCPMRIARHSKRLIEDLRAENAGLKTDYEACERVNAELRAECKVLKSQVQALQAEPNSYQTGYDAGRKSSASHAENWRREAQAASAKVDNLRAECEALRKIISESATACGAAVSVDCSLEFMAMLPAEIGSVVGRLRKEAAQ
ncbi:ead/Ea22-like family protein [Pseudomonas amygdali]|uniref:Prophage PSSB64-02, Orf37 n=1 Tax=Pseudomonas amygdali pv. hibisci TaxID=251723 RepID=A0AB34UAQ3_PSEA0|nr:ead/Ea22-like family protein [Pseudomonas amygdali]KPX57046.1 putative prophage PSSB64-02, Orf37 [Pseudomonas amygdali pv. hibisci]RMN61775.1 putative prophage PSSB64-02, Orf37 [Pseudomonas amygdali pv. hibisci]UBT78788.1 ead/Ea22-like family protein [Pseudomonas amygdali]